MTVIKVLKRKTLCVIHTPLNENPIARYWVDAVFVNRSACIFF